MIVLIDNYDSFSFNLYQLLGAVRPDIRVVRNDALAVDELAALAPAAIVLSPGPGRPAAAGICEDVVRRLTGSVPILGVCLGHQAVCEALGGVVTYAAEIMHGKASPAHARDDCPLFDGIAQPMQVGRYHSLEADATRLPPCLKVTAQTEDGAVMAVQHVEHPTFGLQFHPESILTPAGAQLARNFLALVR
ncbi:anthranilate synthase component 2 [Olsenella profusa DSM 13989]|uniref:anthranilate synthase component II n=1 Tax=Olsenella profusa TaxID=138595 RepID=UPI00278592A1|nr:aminodeoxychorismate/anthranilate synthase component II [Olsenella profusa]MDP9860054.1 anthranilate synthase component 2 [Olsenella profusa DSM 13989]